MRLILLAMILMIVPDTNAAERQADGQSATPTAAKTVAGRTLAECITELTSENRVTRLRAARTIGVFGPPASDQFLLMLDSEDPAIRYLAATYLGRFGGPSLRSSLPRLGEWVTAGSRLANVELPASQQPASQPLAVRMAAAYAVCSGTSPEDETRPPAMDLLVESLSDPERGVACTAADLLGSLGEKATAAIEALEKTAAKNEPGVKGGDYHVGGAANNALRRILAAQDDSKTKSVK